MPVTRRFVGWNRPVAELMGAGLAEAAAGATDFTDWLVLVPTSGAGRRLLDTFWEALGSPEALLPPQFLTPVQFLEQAAGSDSRLANSLNVKHAWTRILEGIDDTAFQAVFPVSIKHERRRWAMETGKRLQSVRQRLVEGGWDMGGVSRDADLTLEEERWDALGRLEALYRAELSRRGLLDPEDWKRRGAGLEALGSGVKRIFLCGVPSLLPAVETQLKLLASRGVSIDVLVAAPPEKAPAFGELGRPLTGVWERPEIPDSLLDRIFTGQDPHYCIEKIITLAEAYDLRSRNLAVSSAEPAVNRLLIEKAATRGVSLYDPGGESLGVTECGRFIKLVADWFSGQSLAILRQMLEHRYFKTWMEEQDQSVYQLLTDLDALQATRFVESGPEVLKLKKRGDSSDHELFNVKKALQLVQVLCSGPDSGAGFSNWIWNLLETVTHAIDLDKADEAGTVGELSALGELLRDSLSLEGEVETRDEFLEQIVDELGERRVFAERQVEDMAVSGWLEVAWLREPHLVLAGLLDACVPGENRADAFLPDALCRELGLSCQADRAAEDGYRLCLLGACRQDYGRLDILNWRNGLDGSFQIPCRFLFSTEPEKIPGRVKRLLPKSPPGFERYPAVFEKPLQLPKFCPPESVSVTTFRSYLACPFRCYLERILRYEPWRGLPREMDALSFGTLTHAVFENFHMESANTKLKKADDIAAALIKNLHEERDRTFGDSPQLAIQIQCDSIEERLRWAADCIAFERESGWYPEAVEWNIHDQAELRIGGLLLRGKIDLVERNRETGQLRVIDFKTTDKRKKPQIAHLAGGKRAENPAFPEAVCQCGKKPQAWLDLQLPLYSIGVEAVYGTLPTTGYFCFGRTREDVGIDLWDIEESVLDSARQCAEAVATRIREGVFWPPSEKPPFDAWGEWLGEDPALRIAEGWHLGGQLS